MAKDLTTLRLETRQRADMESDPLVGDPELDRYINNRIRELYARIIVKWKDSYLATPSQFTVTTGNSTQALPAGFFKERGLDRLDGTRWLSVPVFNFRERNRTDLPVSYRVDSLIRLSPPERAPGTYRLWYYPEAPVLAAPGNTLDAQLDRWSQLITVPASIDCLNKAQLDISSQMAEMAKLERDFDAAEADQMGEPEQAPVPDIDDRDRWR